MEAMLLIHPNPILKLQIFQKYPLVVYEETCEWFLTSTFQVEQIDNWALPFEIN